MGMITALVKKLFKISIYLLIFASLVVFIPNLPPYTTFTRFEVDELQPLVGSLALNEALNNAEKLYTDKLLGPEAFQLHKGEVYTGLLTGEIVKLSPGGHVTFVTKIGQPCSGLNEEHKCGRPLGFAFDKNDHLYVADSYYGIWKVDLKTDRKQLLVSPGKEINGQKPKLFNSLTLDKQNNMYWTDSSADFLLKDGAYAMLADPSGRLFKYDAVKNESTVLLDNIWFANGVAVSPDDQFVTVAECFGNKIYKYYINGPKKGKSEVFVTGLPGTPDNLRALPDGSGFLVGLYSVVDENSPLLTRSLAATPNARKFLARIQRLVEIGFEFLHEQYPQPFFQDVIHSIGHFKSLQAFVPKVTGLLQIDWNGNVVASYYNTDGSVVGICDAIVYNDKLLLGSPINNYIGAVPVPPLLKKAFAGKAEQQKEKANVKVEAPKVAQQPKPTPAPAKPKTTESAKPTTTTPQPPKQTPPPVQVEKKAATPKPTENKETPKPAQEQPKVTQPKPTQAPPKVTQPKPEVKASTQKPVTVEKKETVGSKTATKPTESPAAAKQEAKAEAKQTKPKETVDAPKKQTIPIKEEIPSDTVKPNKKNLKVIKKDGPTEIPNPKL